MVAQLQPVKKEPFYSPEDTEIAQLWQQAQQAEDTAINAGKAALTLYRELGGKLQSRKAITPHGEWLPFLNRLGIDQNRAQRSIRIAAKWEEIESKSVSVTDLTLTEALKLIAQPKRLDEGAIETAPDLAQTTPILPQEDRSTPLNVQTHHQPTQRDSEGNNKEFQSTSESDPDSEAEEVESGVAQGRDRVTHSRTVMTSANTCEHYTPGDILNAVYDCLGRVDLDPCSNSTDPEVANVDAAFYFTKEMDGLAQPWGTKEDPSRIFINPPYSMPREVNGDLVLNKQGDPIMVSVMNDWVDKLLAEYEAGHVSEAIALVKGATAEKWHRKLRDFVRCEYAGRVTFVGNDNPATFSTHLFYLGDDIAKFWRCFSPLGDIWQRIEPGMFGE